MMKLMAMASAANIPCANFIFFTFLILSLCTQVSGYVECEELHAKECAFAVSSSGARCVLVKTQNRKGVSKYKCQTSLIMAEKQIEMIETDECINACGLYRMSIGLSIDSLLNFEFTERLCAMKCRDKCSNINDLFMKLAAREGIYLPRLCEVVNSKIPRKLAELGWTTLTQKSTTLRIEAASLPYMNEATVKLPAQPPSSNFRPSKASLTDDIFPAGNTQAPMSAISPAALHAPAPTSDDFNDPGLSAPSPDSFDGSNGNDVVDAAPSPDSFDGNGNDFEDAAPSPNTPNDDNSAPASDAAPSPDTYDGNVNDVVDAAPSPDSMDDNGNDVVGVAPSPDSVDDNGNDFEDAAPSPNTSNDDNSAPASDAAPSPDTYDGNVNDVVDAAPSPESFPDSPTSSVAPSANDFDGDDAAPSPADSSHDDVPSAPDSSAPISPIDLKDLAGSAPASFPSFYDVGFYHVPEHFLDNIHMR